MTLGLIPAYFLQLLLFNVIKQAFICYTLSFRVKKLYDFSYMEDQEELVQKLAQEALHELKLPHEVNIVSAHRTPERMREYAQGARGRGLKVIIAGAGGAAHLPGMTASYTSLPVLGVPVESKALSGMDSLLS